MSWRIDDCITKDSKDDLIKLAVAEDILEYLSSGSTANSTFVMFDPDKGSRDSITTWFEMKTESISKLLNSDRVRIRESVCEVYFSRGKNYLSKNVICKLQNVVLQHRDRLLNNKACNNIMTCKSKESH